MENQEKYLSIGQLMEFIWKSRAARFIGSWPGVCRILWLGVCIDFHSIRLWHGCRTSVETI